MDSRHDTRGLSPDFYIDPDLFAQQRCKVLGRSWHYLASSSSLGEQAGSVSPQVLLPGSLDEPVVLLRHEGGGESCLSNVCSHRAAEVVLEPGIVSQLRCPYHGRCFGLDGRLRSAPGFADPSGDLEPVQLARLGPFLFAALEATQPFPSLDPRLVPLPWDELRLDASLSSSWSVRAHWALYVENYLEGLHIPFVHPGLSGALDWKRYRYEEFDGGSLQVGIAAPGEPAFAGEERVAGWYLWLFPTTMLNIYPWGVSLNRVLPVSSELTRIEFEAWQWNPSLSGVGAGSGLDVVEREDEVVVESVARGLRSLRARRSEYSPEHERGLQHFHSQLRELL